MTQSPWFKIVCKHCLAQPGEPCVDEYGEPLAWAPAHLSRIIAVTP